MIKEYAVEPEVMATWQHFREIFDDVGASHGRLVAVYPTDWTERVRNLRLKLSPPVRAAAITERMRHSPHKFIPANRAFDKGKDWLTNAEKHEPPKAFDAIIARTNPRNRNRVLVAGEFPRHLTPWQVPHQREVPRTAANLLACAKLLLESSDEILLVDQNFDPAEPRFKDPLAAWLQSRNAARPWKRCELHLAHPLDNGAPDKKVLGNRQHYLQRNLADVIPGGSVLRAFHWLRKTGGKKLHPRFILTERGGLQYDYGLDEGDSPGDTTIVTLMDHDLWEAVRADYSQPSPSFDITADCIVAIPGRG